MTTRSLILLGTWRGMLPKYFISMVIKIKGYFLT